MLRFLFFSVRHSCRPAGILLILLLPQGLDSEEPESGSLRTDHHEQTGSS